MAQLHLLVVIDTDDDTMHVEGMDSAPIDSREDVWDDPDWRSPTDAEMNYLIDAEGKLIDALKAAGLA